MTKKELIYGICDLLKSYADGMNPEPIITAPTAEQTALFPEKARTRVVVRGKITLPGIVHRIKREGYQFTEAQIRGAIKGLGIAIERTESHHIRVNEAAYDAILNYLISKAI